MNTTTGQQSPFAQAYAIYRELGWLGTVPLDGKILAVSGKTGHKRTNVTSMNIDRWLRNPLFRKANIGLVMPTFPDGTCIIALDLDDPTKHQAKGDGLQLKRELEEILGELPPTWTNGHGASEYRHLLFRAENHRYNALGGGIDLITPYIRYIAVWPSIHPDTGEMYQWQDPAGTIVTAPPSVGDIPLLPDAWQKHMLSSNATQYTQIDPEKWKDILPGNEQPCRKMKSIARQWLQDPCMGQGGRHDGWLRLCRMALIASAQGHTGATLMLRTLQPKFIDLISDRATSEQAKQESVNAFQWALGTVIPPTPNTPDPCLILGEPQQMPKIAR